MSLRAECDHLVIELALRRLARRTVITPRLASIPNFLLKAFLFLFVWFSQASPSGPTLGTLFFLGKFNQRFAQTPPSHSILLGSRLWFFIWRSLTGFFRRRVFPNGAGGFRRSNRQRTGNKRPKDAGKRASPIEAENTECKNDRSGNPDSRSANRLRIIISHIASFLVLRCWREVGDERDEPIVKVRIG